MPMPSLSRDTQRKYAILRAIDTMERPSLQDIASETGIPAGTVSMGVFCTRNVNPRCAESAVCFQGRRPHMHASICHVMLAR